MCVPGPVLRTWFTRSALSSNIPVQFPQAHGYAVTTQTGVLADGESVEGVEGAAGGTRVWREGEEPDSWLNGRTGVFPELT